MKVSRAEAAASRDRIVQAAGTLFKVNGLDGIGVAEIMKAAGMTHGGFYKHFGSKEELAAEACDRVACESVAKWAAIVAEAPDAPLAALLSSYLSPRHRDRPGSGCLLPTLATDVARVDAAPVRSRFTSGVRQLLELLAKAVPGRTAKARQERALATLACLTGAVVLARAVDDLALSEDILNASGRFLAR